MPYHRRSDSSTQPKPLTLRLCSNTSILGTVFTHVSTRRPVYATTTSGSNTTLWRVDGHCRLSEVASVEWGGGKKRDATVTRPGSEVWRLGDKLPRRKSVFGGETGVYSGNDVSLRWKVSCNSKGLGRQMPSFFGHNQDSGVLNLQVWSCFLVLPTSPNSPGPSSITSSDTPVAVFAPPQPGTSKSEFSISHAGLDFMDIIVFTGILMACPRDAWKVSDRNLRQGRPRTKEEVESMLLEETRAAYPPLRHDGGEQAARVLRRQASNASVLTQSQSPIDVYQNPAWSATASTTTMSTSMSRKPSCDELTIRSLSPQHLYRNPSMSGGVSPVLRTHLTVGDLRRQYGADEQYFENTPPRRRLRVAYANGPTPIPYLETSHVNVL